VNVFQSGRYSDHHPTTIDYPVHIDLRDRLPPATDQGDLGSCTGLALTVAAEYANTINRNDPTRLSALFVYWTERVLEGTTDRDGGAHLHTGIAALAQHGACPDALWPHEPENVLVEPPEEAFSAALPYRITQAYQITSLTEILSCLSSGWPFVFGFMAHESFGSERVARSGRLRMPGATERQVGGHAAMAVGYDLRKKTALVRNTWGPAWGLDGHVDLPLAYFSNPDLVIDCWTIRA
jgi:C1A family cysteine protease